MKTYITSPWGALLHNLVVHWVVASLMASFVLVGNPQLVLAQTAEAAPEPTVVATPALTLSASSIPASQIVTLTNQMRQAAGLNTLAVNTKLSASAQMKADDMARNGYFAHENAQGQRLAYWLAQVGYPYHYAGENLAVGFNTAAGAMNGWKNSPTHYANIVKPEYQEIGIGVAVGSYKGSSAIFVVQHFGATSELVIPVAENVNIEVKPVFTDPKTGDTVVSQPALAPAASQPAPSFIDQTNVPQTPASLNFSLVNTAYAGTEQATQSAGANAGADATQALLAIVVLMVLASAYSEIEGKLTYWRDLLAT